MRSTATCNPCADHSRDPDLATGSDNRHLQEQDLPIELNALRVCRVPWRHLAFQYLSQRSLELARYLGWNQWFCVRFRIPEPSRQLSSDRKCLSISENSAIQHRPCPWKRTHGSRRKRRRARETASTRNNRRRHPAMGNADKPCACNPNVP